MEAPNIMDCKLSDDEIERIYANGIPMELWLKALIGCCLDAQLEKCRLWAEEQVKAEREKIFTMLEKYHVHIMDINEEETKVSSQSIGWHISKHQMKELKQEASK